MSVFTYFPRDSQLSIYQDELDRTFWTAEEVDYSADRVHMADLERIATTGRDEKIGDTIISGTQAGNIITFVKNILCLFAQLDGVVIENLLENFVHEVSRGEKEIKDFYISQAHNELMHSKSYSMQVEYLIEDHEEKRQIYTATLKYPAVHQITEWSMKWFDKNLPIVDRMIAFCCIEGIIFTSGFVAIYRLKEWGLFPGLCTANEFICKDEAVHTKAGINNYHHKVKKGEFAPITQERAYEIIQASIELAFKFTDDAVKPELIGLDRNDLMEYVKLAADKVLEDLGFRKLYNAKNPFEWMEKISFFNFGNFFEVQKITEYQRPAAAVEEENDDGWD